MDRTSFLPRTSNSHTSRVLLTLETSFFRVGTTTSSLREFFYQGKHSDAPLRTLTWIGRRLHRKRVRSGTLETHSMYHGRKSTKTKRLIRFISRLRRKDKERRSKASVDDRHLKVVQSVVKGKTEVETSALVPL